MFDSDANERGFIRRDNNEYGSVKLEGFKANDKTVYAMQKRQNALLNRAKTSFEKAMLEEAQQYL